MQENRLRVNGGAAVEEADTRAIRVGDRTEERPPQQLTDAAVLQAVRDQYQQIGRGGWDDETAGRMGLSPEDRKKSLGELLGINDVRARLDEVRARNDPQLTASAERAALRHIRRFTGNLPNDTRRSTNIGLAAADDAGIPLLAANNADHNLAAYSGPDGKLSFFNFLQGDSEDAAIGDADIFGAKKNGEPVTAQDLAALSKNPDATGITVDLSPELLGQVQPGFDPADQARFMTFLPGRQGILANEYESIGRREKSVEATVKALEKAPDDPHLHEGLALNLNDRGRYEEGLAAADQGVRSYSKYDGLHLARAYALSGLKRSDEAIEANKTAVTLSPHDPQNLYFLGATQYLKGDHADGAATLLQGLELTDPENPSHGIKNEYFYNVLGSAFGEMGHNEDAGNINKAAASLHTDKPMTKEEEARLRAGLTHTLGAEFRGQGRAKESNEMYKKAFGLDPSNPTYGYDSAHSQFASEDFKGAGLTSLQVLRGARPEDPHMNMRLYEIASNSLERIGGSEVDVRRGMAQAERIGIANDPDRAVEPPVKGVRKLTGVFSSKKQGPMQPLTGAEEQGLQAGMFGAFGDVLQKDDPQTAVKAYENAVGLKPGTLGYHLSLADTYTSLGEHEKAAGTVLDAGPQTGWDQKTWVSDSLIGSFRAMGRPEGEFVTVKEAAAFDRNRYGKNFTELLEKFPAVRKTGNASVDNLPVDSTDSQERAYLHNLAGYSLSEKGRPQEAAAAISKAVKADPGNISFRDNLGNVQTGAGDYAGAEKTYRETLASMDKANSRDKAKIHNGLGTVLDYSGRQDEAVRHYTTAGDLDQSFFAPRYNLAASKTDKGDHAGAAVASLDALPLAGTKADKRDTLSSLADTYSGIGRRDLAVGAHRAAAKADPEYPYRDKAMKEYVTAKKTEGIELPKILDRNTPAPEDSRLRQQGYAAAADTLSKAGRIDEAQKAGISAKKLEEQVQKQGTQADRTSITGQQHGQTDIVRPGSSGEVRRKLELNGQNRGVAYDTRDPRKAFADHLNGKGSGIATGKPHEAPRTPYQRVEKDRPEEPVKSTDTNKRTVRHDLFSGQSSKNHLPSGQEGINHMEHQPVKVAVKQRVAVSSGKANK